MTTRSKIEIAVIGLLIIMNFFLIKGQLESLPYILLTIAGAVYFFPIKIILDYKDTTYVKTLLVLSCLISSICVGLTYISWILPEHNETISSLLLGAIIANLILAFIFSTKDKQSLIIHLLLLALVSESIFV